jgi:hypothetical protein
MPAKGDIRKEIFRRRKKIKHRKRPEIRGKIKAENVYECMKLEESYMTNK